MASQVFNQFEVEPFKTSMLLTDVYSGAVLAPPVCETPALTQKEEDGLYMSTAESLRGAKGALAALGLEAAAALCLYGIWQLWHIVR